MILLICPLKIELKNFKKAFINLGYEIQPRATHSNILDTPLSLALGGHGKVNFALNTFNLIKTLKPELVICAGASGGLPGTKVLDVVLGLKTIEHDYKQAFSVNRTLPSFTGSISAIDKLKEENVILGNIASGDEDIVSLKRAKEIQECTGGICVAWEGAGGAKACAKTNTDFLEIRFVSDLCDENTPNDFQLNLEKGMTKLATTLVKLIN